MSQVIGNTGIPSGAKIGKNIVKAFLVQTFADDGTRNTIDLSSATTLTSVALEALLVNPDASKRIYALPKLYDVDLPKADPTFDTATDGTNFFIQDGIRSFTSIMKEQDTILLKALDTAECGGAPDWSVYLVDNCEQVVVEEVDAKIGRPLKIAGGTFNSIYQFAVTGSATNNLTINWDFDKTIKDSRLQLIQVDANADILNATSVVPVNGVVSSITTTTATVTMTFDAGYVGNKQVFTGAVIGDFDLAEISPTPAAIVITSVTENPASSGIYDLVYPLETTADILELTSSTAGIAKKFQLRPASILIP